MAAGEAAKEFDGTTGYYSSGIQGTDSTDFMYSGWLWIEDDGTDRHLWWGNGSYYRMRIATNDKLSIQMNSAVGAEIVNIVSTSAVPLQQWFHLLVDIDTTTGRSNVYIDDSAISLGTDTINSSSVEIDFTRAQNWIGALLFGSALQLFNGCMSEIYIMMGGQTALDFSTESNRRKFIDASGNPVELGADGSTPTGTSPELYAPAGDASDNKGSAGNWTEVGGIVDCLQPPVLGNVVIYDMHKDASQDGRSTQNGGGPWSWTTNDVNFACGSWNLFSGLLLQNAYRFEYVRIDQGQTLENVILTVTNTAGVVGTPDLELFGHDVDNAPDRTGGSQGSNTSASTVWQPTGAGTFELDITAIVQEIVDRVGWVNGNAMEIYIQTNSAIGTTHNLNLHFTETGGATIPKMTITFNAAGWTHTINSVASANMAEVNQTAKANISKINQT